MTDKKHEASMAIQILPRMEKNEMIRVIDKVIEYIKSRDLNIVVCPFETVIEGSLNEIIDILKNSIEIANKEGAKDILAFIKIAYNPLGVMTIDEKISRYNI